MFCQNYSIFWCCSRLQRGLYEKREDDETQDRPCNETQPQQLPVLWTWPRYHLIETLSHIANAACRTALTPGHSHTNRQPIHRTRGLHARRVCPGRLIVPKRKPRLSCLVPRRPPFSASLWPSSDSTDPSSPLRIFASAAAKLRLFELTTRHML